MKHRPSKMVAESTATLHFTGLLFLNDFCKMFVRSLAPNTNRIETAVKVSLSELILSAVVGFKRDYFVKELRMLNPRKNGFRISVKPSSIMQRYNIHKHK